MKYCVHCGGQIDDSAVICPRCGASQQAQQYNQQGQQYGQQPQYYGQQPQQYAPPVIDNGGFGWGLLGFCIPIVGLILYLVWKDTKPKTSKAAGMGALISVIIAVVFYALTFIIGISAAAMY